MNPGLLGSIMMLGAVSAVYMDVPEHLSMIYDDSVLAAQQALTAGDLRTMAVMLDARYVMDRSLPGETDFTIWLTTTFKENNVKDLQHDHWGTKYLYKVDKKRRSYQLISAGADKVFGSEDDLVKSGP